MNSDTLQLHNPITESKTALLVDCDNVSPLQVKSWLLGLNKNKVDLRWLFGGKSASSNKEWESLVIEYGMRWIPSNAVRKGKNTTDISMVIHALELFYETQVRTFYLVSSDSDFRLLAVKLREKGAKVVGAGAQNTPESFIRACHSFDFLPEPLSEIEPLVQEHESLASEHKPFPEVEPPRELLLQTLQRLVKELQEENKELLLGVIAQKLQTRFPGFRSKNYGFKKFSKLVMSLGFQVSNGLLLLEESREEVSECDEELKEDQDC